MNIAKVVSMLHCFWRVQCANPKPSTGLYHFNPSKLGQERSEGPQMTFISFKSCAKVPGFWWSPISNSHWLLWAPSHLQLPPHRPQAPGMKKSPDHRPQRQCCGKATNKPTIWGWFIHFWSNWGWFTNWVNYHIYQPDISQLSSHYGWLIGGYIYDSPNGLSSPQVSSHSIPSKYNIFTWDH